MICIKICLVYYILSKVHIIIPFHESILLGSDRIPIHFGPASIPSVSRQACSKVTAEGHCLGGSAMTWWTLRKWHEMNQQDVFFGSKDRIFMVMYFSFLAMVIYSYGFMYCFFCLWSSIYLIQDSLVFYADVSGFLTILRNIGRSSNWLADHIWKACCFFFHKNDAWKTWHL